LLLTLNFLLLNSEDTNAKTLDRLELKQFILLAIKERICKNNVLVVAKIVKKGTKKAQIFKES
jgi:hypothetical protein